MGAASASAPDRRREERIRIGTVASGLNILVADLQVRGGTAGGDRSLLIIDTGSTKKRRVRGRST